MPAKQFKPSTSVKYSCTAFLDNPQLHETTDPDEQLAQQLQEIYDEESKSTYSDKNEKTVDLASLIEEFNKEVDTSQQFRIVLRRGVDLFRKLSIWKRAANRDGIKNYPLTVSYVGEQGVDTGAIGKDFYTSTIVQIGSTMFTSGSPIDSTLHVHNGNYRASGQIIGASLAQGGAPPAFLAESVFNQMVCPEVDLMNFDMEKHLTADDKVYLQSVIDDLPSKTDIISDHGYTGPIDSSHVEDIRKSIAISIFSKRSVFLKEFVEGLKGFGVADAVKAHPDITKELFVFPSQEENKVGANYLYSILVPHYSEEGSTRRKTEEVIMDSFQDLLFRIEDGQCPFSHTEAITCNEADEPLAASDSLSEESSIIISSTEKSEEFESADLSIPGIMGWLTGQKHKPVGGDIFTIDVHFDHDCMFRNPNHRLCFPVVGACTKQVTIPVQHMKTSQMFEEVFLLAFGKGQSFSRI